MAEEKSTAETKKRKLPKGRHPSAIKRHRQGLKRAEANRSTLSAVRTAVKRVAKSVEKKDKALMQSSLREAVSELHRAAAKRIIKDRNASRQIARLSSLVSKAH